MYAVVASEPVQNFSQEHRKRGTAILSRSPAALHGLALSTGTLSTHPLFKIRRGLVSFKLNSLELPWTRGRVTRD